MPAMWTRLRQWIFPSRPVPPPPSLTEQLLDAAEAWLGRDGPRLALCVGAGLHLEPMTTKSAVLLLTGQKEGVVTLLLAEDVAGVLTLSAQVDGRTLLAEAWPVERRWWDALTERLCAG